MRILVSLVCLFAASFVLEASMWRDPSFEKMAASADLIALCEVTEGGPVRAKVRVVDVWKGHDPQKEIHVTGYNNLWWPPYAIEAEALKKGETHLLFLYKSDSITIGYSLSAKHEKLIQDSNKEQRLGVRRLEELRRKLGKPIEAPGYYVSTPSSGDFPVKENTIRARWFCTSYSSGGAPLPLAIVKTLIKGLLLKQAGESPSEAQALVADKLSFDLIESIKSPEEKKEYPEEEARKFLLYEWLMSAQACYGYPGMYLQVHAAADHEWYAVRTMAAHALRSLGDEDRVLELADLLLGDPDPSVQTQAAESLRVGKFNPRRGGALLLKHLQNSSSARHEPSSLMDPVRNVSSSARESMIRAMTQFEMNEEAHDVLVSLIRDEGLNSGIFSALVEHFLKYPSVKARDKFIELSERCPPQSASLFVDYFIKEGSNRSLRQVGKKLLDPNCHVSDKDDWLWFFYRKHGIHNTVLDDNLTELSWDEKIDDYLVPDILALLIIRNRPDDKSTIDKLFIQAKDSSYALANCFAWMIVTEGPTERARKVLLKLLDVYPSEQGILACSLFFDSREIQSLVSQNRKCDPKYKKHLLAALKMRMESKGMPNSERLTGWIELAKDEAPYGYGSKGIWWNLAERAKRTDEKLLAETLRKHFVGNEPNYRSIPALVLLSVRGIPLTDRETKFLIEEGRRRRSASIFRRQVSWTRLFQEALR